MDFFERQEKARRNTKLLVVYFVTGVALLILVVYLVAVTVFTASGLRHRGRHYNYNDDIQIEAVQHSLWNPRLFLGVAIGTLAVIGIGSAFKTMELAQGGSAVSSMMGGRLLNPSTTDLDERKLLNVVEEMALASGVAVPRYRGCWPARWWLREQRWPPRGGCRGCGRPHWSWP